MDTNLVHTEGPNTGQPIETSPVVCTRKLRPRKSGNLKNINLLKNIAY